MIVSVVGVDAVFRQLTCGILSGERRDRSTATWRWQRPSLPELLSLPELFFLRDQPYSLNRWESVLARGGRAEVEWRSSDREMTRG
jgi:hypothetical protein